MNKVLVVMVGPQASGKSTWVANNAPGARVLSPDALLQTPEGYRWSEPRVKEAWARCHVAFRAILHAPEGATGLVVWDAMNLDRARRTELLAPAQRAGWTVIGIAMLTPLEVCLARNEARPPDRRLTPSIIIDAQRRMTLPTTAEGFNLIQRIRLP